jgi:hypothetical protein
VEPANVPPVPRAGDAPAVVWVIYGDGSIWGAYDERVRAESSFRSPLHEPHTLALYARVPDAATLDARIAAVERMDEAVRLLAQVLDGTPFGASAAQALIGEIEGTIGGHDETVRELLTDLRAARDASGRDVASGNPSPEQAP